MATVGRTTECTIVPKNHFGPIPGVEVGTMWKFRVQVPNMLFIKYIRLFIIFQCGFSVALLPVCLSA